MRSKTDNSVTRRLNRAIVIEILRSGGPMARIDIGQITGLSPAMVTTISADLIFEKAILELGDSPPHGNPSQRGRTIVRIDLNPDGARIIAIKISIDCIELALADFTGRVRARKLVKTSTSTMSSATFGSKLIQEINEFLNEHDLESRSIVRIGIAAQRLIDSRNGIILWSPAFNNRNIHVIAPFQEAFGIPCSIANDTNMIAEALMSRERYSFTGNAVIVFMGYGVGMGLVIDGTVYHGSSGAAAEFGHMNHIPGGALCRCGRSGCIEAYVSDYGILRNAENLPDRSNPSPKAIDPELTTKQRFADWPTDGFCGLHSCL